MIKANELRLNNWVSITGSHIHLNDPIKLAFILEEDGLETRCEGIPLTEQWLLRGGFVLKDSGYISTQLIPHTEIKISRMGLFTDTGLYNYELFYNKSNRSQLYIDVQYVHQLQNLYFTLTGQELEFKD